MPSIGDIANDLARALYEQRVLVTVASISVVVLLAAIARRRGWLGSARRHPRRTLGSMALVLAVAAPLGWYLGSPIFVRTSLVEAFPSPAPSVALPSATPDVSRSPAAATPSSAGSSTPGPSQTATPFVAATVARGDWQGTDDFHFASGTASIIEVEPGRFQLRLEDFSVRNGPDLYVLLSPSRDGWTRDSLELGLLKATDGSFGYDLPDGADPADYRSAIVWCKAFSHLFATAPFEA